MDAATRETNLQRTQVGKQTEFQTIEIIEDHLDMLGIEQQNCSVTIESADQRCSFENENHRAVTNGHHQIQTDKRYGNSKYSSIHSKQGLVNLCEDLRHPLKPGEVHYSKKMNVLFVGCKGNTCIGFKSVRLKGKKTMDGHQFFNGYLSKVENCDRFLNR